MGARLGLNKNAYKSCGNLGKEQVEENLWVSKRKWNMKN